jgi:CNT family concentrative nucleoside transporter
MIQSVLGILVFIAVPCLFSEARRQISWLVVLSCLLLQFILALLLLKVPFLQSMLLAMNHVVDAIDSAAKQGASYMFGYLGGAPLPFDLNEKGSPLIIAFQVLPVVLVMSALSSVLFYWGVLQKIIQGLGLVLRKTLRLDGLESFVVAASLFFGIVETPLLVRFYFQNMPRSTLFLLLTAGMSTVAGTVMVLYATQLQGILPNPVGHILTASIISLPAAVLMAHLWVPGTVHERTPAPDMGSPASSALDALVKGSEEGIRLMLNIIGMVIVLFASVHLLDQLLQWGLGPGASLQSGIAMAFRPLVWLMGVPVQDIDRAASLLGIKVVFNEFVAYQSMAEQGRAAMSDHSNLVMVYALCGFANFASLGLIMGSIGTLAPERSRDLAQLAPKALLAGLLATCMTGAVVGLISLW